MGKQTAGGEVLLAVESILDPCAPGDKARRTSLHIAYRFEVPDLEDVAPRTAKTPLAPLGLILHRAHPNVVLVADVHEEEAREAARELLKKNPKLQGIEMVAQLQARGFQIAAASVSQLRTERNKQSAKV